MPTRRYRIPVESCARLWCRAAGLVEVSGLRRGEPWPLGLGHRSLRHPDGHASQLEFLPVPRPWGVPSAFFACPTCGGRVKSLYVPPAGQGCAGRWACRACHQLTSARTQGWDQRVANAVRGRSAQDIGAMSFGDFPSEHVAWRAIGAVGGIELAPMTPAEATKAPMIIPGPTGPHPGSATRSPRRRRHRSGGLEAALDRGLTQRGAGGCR